MSGSGGQEQTSGIDSVVYTEVGHIDDAFSYKPGLVDTRIHWWNILIAAVC